MTRRDERHGRARASGPWWPARLRVAVLATLAAAFTTLWATLAGGEGWAVRWGVAYLAAAGAALFAPALVAAQVVTGQLMVWSLATAPDGPGALLLAPAVAGIVVTAELLAAVARMDGPVESPPGSALPQAGQAAATGAVVFVLVAEAVGLPSPTGLPALVLGASACALMAWLLVRRRSS